MPDFTQANRPIRVTTALGPDALLLTRVSGYEAVSDLFEFDLELIAPRDKPADFSKVLGQPALVEMDVPGGTRYFHGLLNRFRQGKRDEDFIYYRAAIVPFLWLWSKRTQSRIFQHMTVPEILQKVLDGLPADFKIEGKFEPRDYCVQYRESDFAFASRLMEEEGIYYYFTHAKGGHRMVLANTPKNHADVPIAKKLIYEETLGGNRPEQRIYEWEKVQELRSGKVSLWDHTFELPHKHLEAEAALSDGLAVGKVKHKLQFAGLTDRLELYDFPGGYAQRFDGVDPGGGDRASDLQKIFDDNARTAGIRMQEEASQGVYIEGFGSCGQMTAGHQFTLDRHFDADGDYVLTWVEHDARLGSNYRSGDGTGLDYTNRFWCIPQALPFRPARVTPKPTVEGTQTAVVVGPSGHEIFTDKYSRIKVQFHWDREGKYDENSSCWVRVATVWAGQGWGVIHIPRIGQEVVVDFLEGDPDQPIVVGSVFNADQMPAFGLPDNAVVSGFKTNSTPGGGGYNEVTLNDTKGKEKITIHGQYDMNTTVEHDQTTTVHNTRTDTIDSDDTETVGGNQKQHVVKDQTINIDQNRTETVKGNDSITVVGNRDRKVSGNEDVSVTKMRTHFVGINESVTVIGAQEISVGGMQTVSVVGYQAISVVAYQTIGVTGWQKITVGRKQDVSVGTDQTVNVGGKQEEKIKGARIIDVGADDSLTVKTKLAISAGDEIGISTGSAKILMSSDGTISIEGKKISINGTEFNLNSSGKITQTADSDVTVKGSAVKIN